MPTIDLNEKRDLLVRREDIIATIRTSITDGEILEDIIESVERQVVARCAELGRVSIPYFGVFVPNEGKLDAIEHQHVMKVHRDTMSREEYMEFKKIFFVNDLKLDVAFAVVLLLLIELLDLIEITLIESLKDFVLIDGLDYIFISMLIWVLMILLIIMLLKLSNYD